MQDGQNDNSIRLNLEEHTVWESFERYPPNATEDGGE